MNLNGSKHKGLSHTYSTRMHLNRLFMIVELLIPIWNIWYVPITRRTTFATSYTYNLAHEEKDNRICTV